MVDFVQMTCYWKSDVWLQMSCGCPLDNLDNIFGCPASMFWLPRANG